MTPKEILKTRRGTSETRDIPGLGTIVIRRLSGADMLQISEAGQDSARFSWTAIARAAVDLDGAPLFDSAEDVAATDWDLLKPIQSAVFEVNKLAEGSAGKNPIPSSS